MSENRILRKDSIGPLVSALVGAGRRVLAPVRVATTAANPQGRVVFAEVTSPDRIANGYIQTASSAKDTVFPRHEPLLRFRVDGKHVTSEEVVPPAVPTVLFGLRPCDAAAFATLKAVFTWDSPDSYFESRLANLTIIGMACTQADEYCFCMSVGGGPGDTRGSDILLTPLDDSRFLAEILTAGGVAVAQLVPNLFEASNGSAKESVLAKVKPRFAAEELAQRLPKLFDKADIWTEQALRCIGCGACAFVCPACSCFDIQDEHHHGAGVRLRCWDSCGFSLYTQHASGHNPRPMQNARWRQRIMHKFSYQPARLGVLGCVGCGRCSRACPADMNLAEHLQSLAEVSV